MITSVTIKGSALKSIWFVVDAKTDEKIAKFNNIAEAMRYADSYDKRKQNK